MVMPPYQSWGRMRNYAAHEWFDKAHESADAIVFSIQVPNQIEDYVADVNGSRYRKGWEQDRYAVSDILRKPQLVENPNKPLLLLVNKEGEEEDFDVERIVNLLGLSRLSRPFRAVVNSVDDRSDASAGALREAFDWLAKTASTKEDEATAMTGSDTEEESSVVTSSSSVVTSTSTAATLAQQGGHYVLDYEPTLLGGNATLQWFEPIKKGTHCPFARASKLWGGKLADDHKPRLYGRQSKEIDATATLNAGPLAEFVARSTNGEALDGFCLELPRTNYGIENLGEDVCMLLTKFAELDPSPGENAMKMGPIDQPHWRFRFAGEDFFITTFSSEYKKESSRYAFKTNKSFVLFQPMTSFGRHGLVEDTPASATNWENPTTMRDKARVAFKNNGCPYHIPETLPYPVAEHIVKPAEDDGTSAIRWWEPVEPKKTTRGR